MGGYADAAHPCGDVEERDAGRHQRDRLGRQVLLQCLPDHPGTDWAEGAVVAHVARGKRAIRVAVGVDGALIRPDRPGTRRSGRRDARRSRARAVTLRGHRRGRGDQVPPLVGVAIRVARDIRLGRLAQKAFRYRSRRTHRPDRTRCDPSHGSRSRSPEGTTEAVATDPPEPPYFVELTMQTT